MKYPIPDIFYDEENPPLCICGEPLGEFQILCENCKAEAKYKFNEFLKTLTDEERIYLDLMGDDDIV